MTDIDLDLQYIDCKKGIDEARKEGEKNPSLEYHILVKGTKTILVQHFVWQKCQFCHIEDGEGIVYLD